MDGTDVLLYYIIIADELQLDSYSLAHYSWSELISVVVSTILEMQQDLLLLYCKYKIRPSV